MKISVKTLIAAFLWMGLAAAVHSQESVENHFTIPLNDPSRPATVDVHVFAGSISVKGYSGKEVIVDIKYSDEREKERERPDHERPDVDTTGLKKIATTGLTVEQENNMIEIRTGMMSSASNITLQVPEHTMLVLKQMSDGDITVEQVRGEIEVNNLNGDVNLTGVSGSVVAHALNGNVKVALVDIEPDTPSSFSSMNGDIDVSLPADLKANVSLKTAQGDIFSGFDIMNDPRAIQDQIDESRNGSGEFEIKIDGTVRGTINGGGPEMQFKTFNGNIYIRKLSR